VNFIKKMRKLKGFSFLLKKVEILKLQNHFAIEIQRNNFSVYINRKTEPPPHAVLSLSKKIKPQSLIFSAKQTLNNHG
jgi:hypothetical protein